MEIQQYENFWRNCCKQKNNRYSTGLQKIFKDSPSITTTTLSLINIPDGENPWRINDCGTEMSLEGAKAIGTNCINQNAIKWFLFIIYHYTRSTNRTINGKVEGQIENRPNLIYILSCTKNIVEMKAIDNSKEGGGKGENTFIWDPADSDIGFKKLFIHVMKVVLERSGIMDWNIDDSEDEGCHINPDTKTILLSDKQLLKFTKLFGVKGLVKMIKGRILAFSKNIIMDPPSPSRHYAANRHHPYSVNYRNRINDTGINSVNHRGAYNVTRPTLKSQALESITSRDKRDNGYRGSAPNFQLRSETFDNNVNRSRSFPITTLNSSFPDN